MEQTERIEYLKSCGWYQWYNPSYWCHEQFASASRDPTNWGMSTDEAYLFETDEESKAKTLAGMNILSNALQTMSNLGLRNTQ